MYMCIFTQASLICRRIDKAILIGMCIATNANINTKLFIYIPKNKTKSFAVSKFTVSFRPEKKKNKR